MFAVVALVFVLWRGMPDALLLGICPLGIVAVTATVAVAEPIALTPVFYLWPMLVAAYFLSPRAVAAKFTELHGATAFAESLRERLAGAQAKPALTVSLGVSDLSTSGPSMRRMLQQADDALYAAKRAGRNRVACAPQAAGWRRRRRHTAPLR